MRIRFTPEAIDDLLAIRDFIAEDNPTAGDRTLLRIEQSIRHLELFPRLGPKWIDGQARVLTIPALPYRVIYDTDDDEVVILAVIHTSRKVPD